MISEATTKISMAVQFCSISQVYLCFLCFSYSLSLPALLFSPALTTKQSKSTAPQVKDSLHGTNSGETVNGGDDTLNGGDGNDRLYAHDGDDTLTGGAGNDIFRFQNSAVGTNTITDFNPSEDVLVLQIYDEQHPAGIHTVTIEDWADETGADLLVNGVIFAHVNGAPGLDPALVNATIISNPWW